MGYACERRKRGSAQMAKDHGPSVKNDKQYEELRKKGMSKSPGGGDLELARGLQQGRQELGQQPK